MHTHANTHTYTYTHTQGHKSFKGTDTDIDIDRDHMALDEQGMVDLGGMSGDEGGFDFAQHAYDASPGGSPSRPDTGVGAGRGDSRVGTPTKDPPPGTPGSPGSPPQSAPRTHRIRANTGMGSPPGM